MHDVIPRTQLSSAPVRSVGKRINWHWRGGMGRARFTVSFRFRFRFWRSASPCRGGGLLYYLDERIPIFSILCAACSFPLLVRYKRHFVMTAALCRT